MMEIDAALATYLVADPVVISVTGGRLHPRLDPDPVLPALTYRLVDNLPEEAHDGDTGFATSRVQVDAWGATRADARRAARAVQSAVRRAPGVLHGLRVYRLRVAMMRGDLYEAATGRYRVWMDLVAEHEEGLL